MEDTTKDTKKLGIVDDTGQVIGYITGIDVEYRTFSVNKDLLAINNQEVL